MLLTTQFYIWVQAIFIALFLACSCQHKSYFEVFIPPVSKVVKMHCEQYHGFLIDLTITKHSLWGEINKW